MFVPGATPLQMDEIRSALIRPEGTFRFRVGGELTDATTGRILVLQVPAGGILFRLERDENRQLIFTHASAGTCTRVASVDLGPVAQAPLIDVFLVWSSTEVRLHVVNPADPANMLSGQGLPSPREFQIGADGSIVQIGDENTRVMGVQVRVGGQTVLEPTAINAWRDTLKAIEIFQSGTSPEGFLFEVVCANLAVAMLVTGFETYTKRRFLEIEEEGVAANYARLSGKFFSAAERQRNEPGRVESDAANDGITPARRMVNEGRINFQDYDNCRNAYNRAYGVKFGELQGATNVLLDQVKQFIRYRHRVVHVSALTTMVNQDQVPPEEPVFANRGLAEQAISVFSQFVQALHEATLRLRPEDAGE